MLVKDLSLEDIRPEDIKDNEILFGEGLGWILLTLLRLSFYCSAILARGQEYGPGERDFYSMIPLQIMYMKTKKETRNLLI